MKFFLFVLLGVFLITPVLTQAAPYCPSGNVVGGVCLPDPDDAQISDKSVTDTIVAYTKGFLTMIAILTVLMIVVAGIMYITSGGESDRLESAKGRLLWAVVGLIVVLISWVIVSVVSSVLLK